MAIYKAVICGACLSCGRCKVRCPADIDFPEYNRSFRKEARKIGNRPQESHHGILQTVASLQTRNLKQQRTAWAEAAGKFQSKGDVFYFVGCLPYFEVTFRYLNLSPMEIGRSVLTLLNRMGIEPVISNDERCCGHDALWSGKEEIFLELARWNLEVIKAAGAKTVLFSCPEGYYTFKHHYTQHLGELPFEVLHISEFLARELPGANLSFQPSDNGVVTFQDPCRLGRLDGNYDQPRELLQMVPDTQLKEMLQNKENAQCCGTSAWMQCTSCSKSMQLERLQEAARTGASTLITTCPKCQIHLTCARSDTEMDLKIVDLCTYLSQQLSDG